MFFTVLIFILILGLLVFVHELGHFIVAKRSAMKVDEFGFGFPPRLIGIQKVDGHWKIVWGHSRSLDSNYTVYSINAVPLGGFVKIVGENNESADDPQSFINKPFGRRLATLLAGVVMNVILAWILISIGLVIGLPAAIGSPSEIPKGASLSAQSAVILEVVKDSLADKAGLKLGDTIVSINGQEMKTSDDVQKIVSENKGQQLNFNIKRGQNTETKLVEALAQPPEGQGPTGIVLADVGKLSYPWYLAPWAGLQATFVQLGGIVNGLYQLIASGVGFESLGGPVKIAQLTGQAADLGFAYMLQFAAFLSLNLTILNALPFPALDGGRILFLLIEKVRGKRNNQKIEQWANTFGFVLLLLLMLAVTVKDIRGL